MALAIPLGVILQHFILFIFLVFVQKSIIKVHLNRIFMIQFSVDAGKGRSSSQVITVNIVVSVVAALVLLFIALWCITTKARKRYNVGNDMITVQSLEYDLRTIEAATDNFCDNNKIGEGGFGAVYKGMLPNGQEIAVKRLSKSSGQGENEFKNEVILVAKLQHRNLVRLLGFCLERQEKILIYEFVPNKSLDNFLFDPEKGKQLDWSRRYKIISGIARGILYLHEDSQLRVIHRDLKASNVLLDGDMNPKVSDFGMARIFGMDQTQGNTNRIVGTFGYMSPEYAMQGQFSVKSDVFSFGVSILEIITGKKNRSFYQSYGVEGLLGYAWKHWRDGTPLELMDPTLKDSYSRDEVIRCIHIGLLCVQEDMDVRPSMSSVVHMLNSSFDTLPLPQQPPFFVRGRTEFNFEKRMRSRSFNEVTISELKPR
ncbi:cysteine-rich receptor-like protein kinase 10 [Cornus florida]|uniref:cysteine-rich receptor-like protein kinase 10 n=1 Tax=Cornus florida TaxID=4283 RepID=UPI0028963017|nr:cysteine-rich receptor-like protein kinase 10 [Cornus florida]